jgi:hypothetical protein
MSAGSFSLRRGEFRTRFAWIWIDAENQKFGHDRAEIDFAVDQGLRRLVRTGKGRDLDLPIRRLCACRRRGEHNIDLFVQAAFHRLKRDDAGLTDKSRDLSGHADSSAAPAEIEHGREPRDLAYVGEGGKLRPRLGRRLDFHMQTGIGDISRRDRHAPRAIVHDSQSFSRRF